MLTLYYGPGACSMASHIAIEETGAPYEAKPIMLPKGEQKTEAYLKINPRGRVPALAVNGTVLTENVAILTYLAKRFPGARLLPTDLFEEMRCLSVMAWFSNFVHPSVCRAKPSNNLRLSRSRPPKARSCIWKAIIRPSRSLVRAAGGVRPNTARQRRRRASIPSERMCAISASTMAGSIKRWCMVTHSVDPRWRRKPCRQ
jgi:glutathione S-transferase